MGIMKLKQTVSADTQEEADQLMENDNLVFDGIHQDRWQFHKRRRLVKNED